MSHHLQVYRTPTDNPKVESLNGWIKDELIHDFNMKNCEDIYKLIDDYINYYNNEKYSYALQGSVKNLV